MKEEDGRQGEVEDKGFEMKVMEKKCKRTLK